MTNTYDVGDSVTLVASIAATSGGMIDPTSLYLTVRWPDSNISSWGYADFVKVSTGHYEYTINSLHLSGIYWQRWSSTGSGQAAEALAFKVRDNVALS